MSSNFDLLRQSEREDESAIKPDEVDNKKSASWQDEYFEKYSDLKVRPNIHQDW